jgi:hypothetical protein
MDIVYSHLVDCCVGLLDGFDCESVAADYHLINFFTRYQEVLLVFLIKALIEF